MSLEQALNQELKHYLEDVQNVLIRNGSDKNEIDDLLENLHHHALEKARGYAENISIEEAVKRTVASLESPLSYATTNHLEIDPTPENKDNHSKIKNIIGLMSAMVMASCFLLSIIFSKNELLDTPISGSILVFGGIFAFGLGLVALPNIWGKLGAVCSGLILSFIAIMFLWVTFS